MHMFYIFLMACKTEICENKLPIWMAVDTKLFSDYFDKFRHHLPVHHTRVILESSLMVYPLPHLQDIHKYSILCPSKLQIKYLLKHIH